MQSLDYGRLRGIAEPLIPWEMVSQAHNFESRVGFKDAEFPLESIHSYANQKKKPAEGLLVLCFDRFNDQVTVWIGSD